MVESEISKSPTLDLTGVSSGEVVTGCWHDSRTREFVLHFNSSINNDPMCLLRPLRNRTEQQLPTPPHVGS